MRVLGSAVTALVISAFAACGGDAGKAIDAAGGSNLPACTGLLYDSCNAAASNCQNGMTCKAYGTSGFSVCVPAQGQCTSGGCPNQGSATVPCNTMGFCKPAGANADCQSP
jgi:hypothetical protein